MRDFWPSGAEVLWFRDHNCRIGYADGELCGCSYFVRDPSAPDNVAEIRLEWLGPEEHLEGADARLFARLRLPLAAGMTQEQLTKLLGDPFERIQSGPDREVHVGFLCGDPWAYYIFCIVWPGQGLRAVYVVRKDAYDRELARQAQTDDEDEDKDDA